MHRDRKQHPLGRLIECRRARRPIAARAIAGGVLCASVSLLWVSAALVPSPSGLGTHQQLGLWPCGAVVFWGLPCPTCGMTTAFAHAVRGEWVSALRAQPAGFLLAVATGAVGMASILILITGRIWTLNWYRVHSTYVGLILLSVVLGGWMFKLIDGWWHGWPHMR